MPVNVPLVSAAAALHAQAGPLPPPPVGCPPCAYAVTQLCVGGHNMARQLPCHVAGQMVHQGPFTCDGPCDKALDCQRHRCSRGCHPVCPALHDESLLKIPVL